jgi:hypothetical protein
MPEFISLQDESLQELFDLQNQGRRIVRPGQRFNKINTPGLSRGGRGRERFRRFIQNAGAAVKKFGPIVAGVGITAVTGGAGAPVLATKLTGAAKLLKKHGPNAGGFLKGLFQAKKGSPHQGPVPVAIPIDAPEADVAAAQEAANLLNNPNPGAFERQAKPTGISQNTLLIGGAAVAALIFLSKKK